MQRAWLAPTIASLLVFICVAAAVAVVVRRSRRKMSYYLMSSTLNQQLLHKSQTELEALKRVWVIEPHEVTLKKFIDQGAYGEVFKSRGKKGGDRIGQTPTLSSWHCGDVCFVDARVMFGFGN